MKVITVDKKHLFSLNIARLCVALAKLGYEGWWQLDVDSFKWPSQYEEI
jgi:hypothetical protein